MFVRYLVGMFLLAQAVVLSVPETNFIVDLGSSAAGVKLPTLVALVLAFFFLGMTSIMMGVVLDRQGGIEFLLAGAIYGAATLFYSARLMPSGLEAFWPLLILAGSAAVWYGFYRLEVGSRLGFSPIL